MRGFLARRLDGLSDEPRPGVPPTISDAQVEEVVVRTLEETPEGASVYRIWRAFGLQPWRAGDFKTSPDPLLIGKIRDVAGPYLAPPANAAVFAVDEKPQIQAYPETIRASVTTGKRVVVPSACHSRMDYLPQSRYERDRELRRVPGSAASAGGRGRSWTVLGRAAAWSYMASAGVVADA